MTRILSIAQGTSNTKALLVGEPGVPLSPGSAPVQLATPCPGWFGQDGNEPRGSVLGAVGTCLAKAPGKTLAGVALSDQRESVVVWKGATGEPFGSLLGWQDAMATTRIVQDTPWGTSIEEAE